MSIRESVAGRDITIINYYYTERSTAPPTEAVLEAGKTALPPPYRGLYHFGPNDGEVFFGREVFTQKLEGLVRRQNFIAVLGASGSGKSSVVLAGLVPALAKIGHWKFTHFRPGDDPFHALATAFVPLYSPDLDKTEQILQARKLATYLRDKTLPLADVITTIRANHPQDRVLLIADQFEELYTLCPDEAIRQQFLDSLIQSLQSPLSKTPYQRDIPSPLVFVLTMRADFLGQALTYRPFADVLQDGDLKLGPMNRDELREVIVNPAKIVGVSFQPGLVERILDDVENQPGSLPLLEFALTLLWERQEGNLLTHKDYEDIGQVEGALAGYAEQKFTTLNEVEQQQARRIFLQLVQPGEGTEDTRRLALKAQVGADNWPLVKRLADARLIVTSRNAAGEETVEVVHEALIQAWGQLRGWINTDRAFLTWQKRLRFALDLWQASQQDKGALLHGSLLTEAEFWLDRRRNDLGQAESNFIRESLALREQEQQREEEARYHRLLVEIHTGKASGRDLSGVNLSEANLSEADLSEANLSRANLSEADLSEADLSEANLSEASLSKAKLIEADLSKANLMGANLMGANLMGANLSEADLSLAKLSEADLSLANLMGADLREANLSEADLRTANLMRANLSEADLRLANLMGADLSGVDLSEANLSEANLIMTKLRGTNLSGTELREADLREADLRRANLMGADLSEAYLGGVRLGGPDLSWANLSEADLREAILDKASYNKNTMWPDGFDPEKAGAELVRD